MASALQWGIAAVFLVLFGSVVRKAMLRPDAPRIRVAAFFGSLLAGVLMAIVDDDSGPAARNGMFVLTLAVAAAPWLFMELAYAFRPGGRALRVAGFVCGALAIAFAFVPAWWISWLDGAVLTFPLGVGAWALLRGSRGASGTTLRRLEAIAAGGVALLACIVVVFFAGAQQAAALDEPALLLFELVAALCLYLGFSTPRLVREWWQAADVTRFLRETSTGQPSDRASATLNRSPFAAMRATGASWAGVALRDETGFTFRASTSPPPTSTYAADVPILAKLVALGQPILVTAGAASAEGWPHFREGVVILTPLKARGDVFGALIVYLPRAPLFEEDAVHMLELLAEQTSIAHEQARLFGELTSALERNERLAIVGMLVASVAHDVANVLTYTRGGVELIALRAADGLVAGPDELAGIVKGLDKVEGLCLSLKHAVREGGERGPVDLNDVVTSVKHLVASAAPRHLIIQTRLDPARPVVLATAARVEQVVLNLAKNAIEAMGAKEGVILLSTHGGAMRAEVRVSDEGSGVPAAVLPRMFEPLYTTKSAGTGLGLSMSRKLAREDGGDLTLDAPVVGEGATFRLRLPVVPPEPRAITASPSTS